MTQESERINEILKQEYDIDRFNVDLNIRKILVAPITGINTKILQKEKQYK